MPDPVYSTYDALHKNEVGLSIGLYCCAQTSALNPNNAEDTGDLSAVTDSTWKLLANVQSMSLGHDEQTDEAEFYDEGGTNSRKKVTEVISTADYLELTLVNHAPLFEMIATGVPDPFNTDGGAGKKVPIFATSEPQVDLCFKLLKKKGSTVYRTEYFYGRLRMPEALNYDGKFSQPKVRIDIQRAARKENAVGVSTTALTGQTVVTSGGGEGGGVSA